MGRPKKYATEEERRAARAEQARQRRTTMAPEKMEEFRRQERERKKNALAQETPEEREKRLKIKRETKRNKLKSEDKTERKARLEKQKIHQYFSKHARLASMTEEEKEESYKKYREKNRQYRKKKTKEEKEVLQRRQYFRVQARLAEMTKEEREEWTRRNTEYARKWREKLQGEKRERYKEYMRKKNKESLQRRMRNPGPNSSSESYERYLEYMRIRTANETPEQRQRRLRKDKINQAVRKLKRALENQGVPQEEIEAKAMELKERMWAEPLPPPGELSTFMPRIKSGGEGEEKFVSKRRRMNQEEILPNPVSTSTSTLFNCDFQETRTETVDVVMTTTSDIAMSVSSAVQSDEFFHDGFHNYQNDCEDNYEEPEGRNEGERKTVCKREGLDQTGTPQNHSTTFVLGVQKTEAEVGDMTMTSTPVELAWSSSVKAQPLQDEDLSLDDGDGFDNYYDDNHEEPEEALSTQTNIKCPNCTSHFPQRSDLTAHISSEHPKKCWKCPKCKSIMLSSKELQEHFKSEHGLKPKEVRPCKKNEIIFSCMKCDPSVPDSEKVFASRGDLNEHVKDKHPGSYWPCSKCSLLKYSERTLKTHEKVCGKF